MNSGHELEDHCHGYSSLSHGSSQATSNLKFRLRAAAAPVPAADAAVRVSECHARTRLPKSLAGLAITAALALTLSDWARCINLSNMSNFPKSEPNTFVRLCKALKCDAVTYSRKFSEDLPLGWLCCVPVSHLGDEAQPPPAVCRWQRWSM